MAISKQKKKEIVKDLTDKLKKAKAVVFSNFSGINVSDTQSLRKKLRENNIDYGVIKKTLIKIASKDAGYKDIPQEFLNGPISLAISYNDEVTPAKILKDFSGEHKTFSMLGGIVDKEILNQDKLKYLASLPTKEELIVRLTRSIKAPISGFYGVLHSLLSGLPRTIKAYAEAK